MVMLDLSDMRKAYSGARVTVVPSVWIETFGYVTIESLACETPVIVTENCGSAECVDETCGSVIPRKDPKAIADTVNDIWDKASEMGKAGREKMELEMSWDVAGEKTFKIFHQVVENERLLL